MDIRIFRIKEGRPLDLKKTPTEYEGRYDQKEDAEERMAENIDRMEELQARLYAEDRRSILVIFQAMDTAGKDGVIKHVMSGLNPQGTRVHSFKRPSAEEINHDYLWRAHGQTPERGCIGIFNRSYYEDVLVVRVHDLLKNQKLPDELITKHVWKDRFRQIRDFERTLSENGTRIVKFFLHISREEQKKRLLKRMDDPSRNWKFEAGDLEERKYWGQYMKCYEEALSATSTKSGPWYVVPADRKWAGRLIVSEIIRKTLEDMAPRYPVLDGESRKNLKNYRKELEKD
jgi:PPK2 family polyphosphate:nucleotide phosphotransferase